MGSLSLISSANYGFMSEITIFVGKSIEIVGKFVNNFPIGQKL